MARAKVLGVERPACPDGHQGRIWLRGTYRGTTGFERTRFTCVSMQSPREDEPAVELRHNFTALLSPRRPAHDHSDDPNFECAACERHYKRAEGSRTPASNLFSVREIATLLHYLGLGLSYRKSSRRLRHGLGRVSLRGKEAGSSSYQAGLAMTALDGFAGVIDAAYRKTSWPHTLVLDSYPYRFEKSPAQIAEERAARAAHAWPEIVKVITRIRRRYKAVQLGVGAVFVAVGYETPGGRPVPWLIRFAPSEDEDSWFDFLGDLDGVPTRVVADRSKAIANAVARRWPAALLFACEFHLRTNAEETLLAERVVNPAFRDDDPLFLAVRTAFRDREGWTRLRELATGRKAVALLIWMAANEELVLAQMEQRRGQVLSNSSAEQIIQNHIKPALVGRTTLLRNRGRLDRMLALVRIEAAGEASEVEYSRLIRKHLAGQGGRTGVDWRSLLDRDHADSVAIAMREAISRHTVLARARNRIRDAPAKAARYRAGVEDYERRREAAGLPPSPRGRPRRIRVPFVAGKFVSDFAWVVADWHPTLNGGLDPSTVKAGSNDDRWWQCPYGADHEYEASPHDRLLLGNGCPFCAGKLTARSESLAVTHPDLAAEWHPTRNGELTPYDVTFGSHREVVWVCPTGYKSHDYPARVSSRTSMKSGCPTCARQRGKGGANRKRRPPARRKSVPTPLPPLPSPDWLDDENV